MNLTLKERLDLQRTARIITESQYNKLLKEEEKVDPKDIIKAFKDSIQIIKQGESKITPSPKDGELDESLMLTAGLIASAPGLLSILGKSVNGLVKFFSIGEYTTTVVGDVLKKWGEELEDAYIGGIGTLLQKAFPKKYQLQNVHDKSSELYDTSHFIYMSILAACALTGAAGLEHAHSILHIAGEGSLVGVKTKEILDLASKINAA